MLEYLNQNLKYCFKVNFNPFMHNVVKWPNILKKICGVNTARFLKYVWPFYDIFMKGLKSYYQNQNFLSLFIFSL